MPGGDEWWSNLTSPGLMKGRRRRKGPLSHTKWRHPHQGHLLAIFGVLVLLATLSIPVRRVMHPKSHTLVHHVITESVAHSADGSATTVRQEQTAIAGNSGNELADWISGAVHGRKDTRQGSGGDPHAHQPSHIVSKAVVQASASGTGLMNKFYYRFDNVQLSRDKISVFYDPGTFTPPTTPHWVDIISGNTTTAALPTMIVLKGDLHNTKWFYLPVEYVSSTQAQPRCTSWVDPMAYLLQVRYSYNIWHTWNEGLMGLFQTLRELGQLPLASVGAGGRLTEITDGTGDGCPYQYNPATDRVVQETDCEPRTGLLERATCDPATEGWCQEGAVVSVRRSSAGPVIVPYTASSVMNVWAHLYSSMTEDVRDWETVEGACFRSLVVGKTSTLNFYQAINNTEPDPEALAKFPRVDNMDARIEAMAVFKGFVRSAQREWVMGEEAKGVAPWGGYKSRSMERLRHGVGPEDLRDGVLDGINAREVPGMLREERAELRSRWKAHDKLVERAVERYMQRYGGAAEARAAAAAEDRAHVDDYEDDYEGVAGRAFSQQYSGGGDGMTGLDEFTDEARRRRKHKHRHRQVLSSAAGGRHSLVRRRKAATAEPSSAKWFDRTAVFEHEKPRPVVTYMSRNFFSRGVLNEGDILAYILAKYNVTMRVTTFEEPLHRVMDLLAATDVMLGMHGAGWTNGLFIKRGATTMQMFPYGWKLPDGSTLRGYNYREIVLASECPYVEWVNPLRQNAFFRRSDYSKKDDNQTVYALHPDPDMPLPSDGLPGNLWIYQNTYVDMNLLGPEIDALMERAGISLMPGL